MAVGAFARDVAVGQEGVGLFVVILHGSLLHELALVVECAEEVRCRLAMHLGRGASIYIERDAELLKRVLDQLMVAVHHVLRRDALLAGPDGDGHAVFVRTADEEYVLLLQPEIAHVDVRRDVHARQVSDMHRPVGVRQGRRDSCSFEFLLHLVLF